MSLSERGKTRVQLCGRFVAELDGERIEPQLPGRQGRLLFAYLVRNRSRQVDRAKLAELLWPRRPPAGAETTLRGLIFRLRRALGDERLTGKSELRLELGDGARVDVEVAAGGLHEAESAIALGRPKQAWLPARIALAIAESEFMPGHEGDWIDEQRRELEELRLRALECVAAVGLRLGDEELAASERAGRALVEAAPFRESGYALLAEALARGGNVAEALRVLDRARVRLRDELGIAPGERLAELHGRLARGQAPERPSRS